MYKFTEDELKEREKLDQYLSEYYKERLKIIKELEYQDIDEDELEAVIDAGIYYGWL